MLLRIKKTLKGEQGILDLASIITGAIIVGILGAVTATTLLAVIPWFDNKVAKDDLSIIKTAQQSHYSDTSQYVTKTKELYDGRYLHKTTNSVCISPSLVDPADYSLYVKPKNKDGSVKANAAVLVSYTHSTGKTGEIEPDTNPCKVSNPSDPSYASNLLNWK